jgi:tetratricopeptide (TPR) repeat protein
VSDQQPDVVKGLDTLIKDQKKVGDAPAALAAVTNALRAANYVTADQTNPAKGIEKLVADKQAADKSLGEAMAKLKDASTSGQDAGAKLQAAEDRAKDATEKLAAANRALEDMTNKARTIEQSVQDAKNQLRDANDTLRDIAAKLAAARVVEPDARGPALARAVDKLVASASAPPVNGNVGRNGAGIVRQPESATPSDPLSAERHYVRGLTNFWAGQYWTAETDLLDAIRAAGTANPDARYYYFLGLTQLALGKRDDARQMFKMAGSLEEQRKPPSAVVSRALERVQGGQRQVVEQYRP